VIRTVFVLLGAAAIAFGFAARASADVGLYPVTKVVPSGGVISGHGDGSGLSVYLVPAAVGPRRYRCGGNAICEPRSKAQPGKPFMRIGRLRPTKNPYATQPFAFAVPADLKPGAYRMYLYCPRCGDSLIQSGRRIEGETIRVTAGPLGRTVRMKSRLRQRRFLVSEPAGVILLLRLTVPHGMRAIATGSLSGIADVRISTIHGACRRHGAVDVCTQPEEWCPMPAAAWRFRLDLLEGSAGKVRLDFVVGSPPT
jgi:hypothetical protein